jgi:hypothetical protein
MLLPLKPQVWSHRELRRRRDLLNRPRAQHLPGPMLIQAERNLLHLRESPLEAHNPQVLGLLEARALKPGQAKEWRCDSTELPVVRQASIRRLRVRVSLLHSSIKLKGYSPCAKACTAAGLPRINVHPWKFATWLCTEASVVELLSMLSVDRVAATLGCKNGEVGT